MVEKLRSCETRYAAKEMLEGLKRKDLEVIAKELSVDRRLNKERLIEKIVESTVGSRLRSEALASIDIARTY